MEIDWTIIPSFLPQLMKGAQVTLMITLIGLIGGTVLGLLTGLMRAYGNVFVNGLALVYVELIRGTPIVVQVMFIYFALPILTGLRIDPMTAAILSIIATNASPFRYIVSAASFCTCACASLNR